MVFFAQLLNVMVGPRGVINARVSRLIRMANNILVIYLEGGKPLWYLSATKRASYLVADG